MNLGNRRSSSHRFQGSQGYKYLSWRKRGLLGVGPKCSALGRACSIGYSSGMDPMDSIFARFHIIKKSKRATLEP